jgi:kumamolisin
MTRMRTSLAAATAALMLLPASQVLAGVPYPTASVPKASDLGSTATVEGAAPITVTVVLKLRDPEGAREELKALTTPGNASFHEFLTPQQFRDSFGPSTDNVEMVSASLRALGLSVSSATSTTLRVTGSPTALEHAFQTSLHTFSVPAYDHHAGYSYHAPLAPVTLPAAAAPLVHAVLGLDTMPHLRPHLHALANKGASHPSIQGVPAGTSTGNAPGQLTVSDYAQHYNVTPLYSKGVTL